MGPDEMYQTGLPLPSYMKPTTSSVLPWTSMLKPRPFSAALYHQPDGWNDASPLPNGWRTIWMTPPGHVSVPCVASVKCRLICPRFVISAAVGAL